MRYTKLMKWGTRKAPGLSVSFPFSLPSFLQFLHTVVSTLNTTGLLVPTANFMRFACTGTCMCSTPRILLGMLSCPQSGPLKNPRDFIRGLSERFRIDRQVITTLRNPYNKYPSAIFDWRSCRKVYLTYTPARSLPPSLFESSCVLRCSNHTVA